MLGNSIGLTNMYIAEEYTFLSFVMVFVEEFYVRPCQRHSSANIRINGDKWEVV